MSIEIKNGGWYKTATPADREVFETWLQGLLLEREVTIKFTKITGESRTMPCTLNPSLLPPLPMTKSTKTRKRAQGVLAVWCMDLQAWRSVRYDSICEILFNLDRMLGEH